jgi:tetratricopeptide (TPR) repeat protein
MRLSGGAVRRLTAACLTLAAACANAAGQNQPAKRTPALTPTDLARIEQSIGRGMIEGAERPLLDYAVARPNDPRALYLLGLLRSAQGRLEEAASLHRRVLALDPAFAKAKISLGLLAAESGRHEEARRLLGEVYASAPADTATRLGLARALLAAGEYQKALSAAERLPPAVRNTEGLPVVAAARFALGDRAAVSKLLPAMRRAAVASPSAAVQCAEVLRRGGMTAEAAGLLRVALASAPSDVDALVALGRLEAEARDFAAARRRLKRAAALAPDSAEVFLASAELEGLEGNHASALDASGKARALAPRSRRVLTRYVLDAMRANRPREAVGAAEALAELDPGEPEFVYLSGAALLQAGNSAAARKTLARYAELRPADPRGCLALGIAHARANGAEAEARREFERCLALDPSNVEAKYQLGLVHRSQGETAEAVRLLEEATVAAPRHADALRDLGALYLQSGDEDRARAALERAVALNPLDAETHFHLSRLHARADRPEQARRHRETFQRLKAEAERGGTP